MELLHSGIFTPPQVNKQLKGSVKFLHLNVDLCMIRKKMALPLKLGFPLHCSSSPLSLGVGITKEPLAEMRA